MYYTMTRHQINRPSVIRGTPLDPAINKTAGFGKIVSGFAKSIIPGVTSAAKKIIPKSIHPEVKILANQKMPIGMLAAMGPKEMLVDPFMDMGSDAKHTYESLMAGDYSTAGGHALSGVGNAIWGLGGLAMALPSAGALTGIGLKASGKVLPGILGRMASGAGKGVGAGGAKLTTAMSKVPGNQWLGLGIGGGGSMVGSIAKPIGLSLGLGLGGEIGKYFGIEAKYNDMAQDPNFRDWMGPRKHDNWINNGSSVKNRVDQMRNMDESGLYERYKKNLKLKEKQYIKDQEEAERVNSYGFPVKYTRPESTVDRM